jgi:hypothetical protein
MLIRCWLVFVDVLHPKIVNNKGEADVAPVMTPVSWCDCALLVSCFVKAFGEKFLHNDAGLWEAVHSALHFAENFAFCVHFVMESVFMDDVLWEEFKFHPEILIMAHGHHEVEVLDVDSHELWIASEDDAVEHQFDGEHICSLCSTVVRVVDQIPSHPDTCAVGVFLLGTIDSNKLAIGYVLAPCLGYLLLCHEGNGLGGCGMAPNLLAKRFAPNIFALGLLQQMAILQVTSLVVKYRWRKVAKELKRELARCSLLVGEWLCKGRYIHHVE